MKPIPRCPNIAFIMPPLRAMLPSGVTTFVRQMVAGFGKYGEHFSVVEVPHGNYEPAVSEANCSAGVSAVVSGKSAGGNIPARRPVAILLILGYLKLLWIDIRRVWGVRAQCRGSTMLTNQFGCETLPIALRLVFPFARIVAISHTHPGQGGESDHWVRRWIERGCYRCLSDVLFNSNASRQQWAKKLGVCHEFGEVVHLGTEPPDMSIPDDYPSRREGVVDFLCVARFVTWKGQKNLVKVWKVLMEREGSLEMGCIGGNELEHNSLSSLPNDTNETNRPLSLLIPNAPPPPPKARLILIGDGPCFEEVRRDAEEAGLGAQVVFMGGRPNADRYFNGADVAVLLSSEPEAFGLTLLEAMSRGKPVLASCIGGIPEIVKDHETGLLVTPGEAEMAASAVCSLANSAMDRQRLGKNGRKRWEEYFTVERMIHGYAVYFKMLDLQGKA